MQHSVAKFPRALSETQAQERQTEWPASLFQFWLRSYGDTCWGHINKESDQQQGLLIDVRSVGLHTDLEQWAEIKLFPRGNVNSAFPTRRSVILYSTFDKLSEVCSPNKSVYLHGWLSFLILTIPSATEK